MLPDSTTRPERDARKPIDLIKPLPPDAAEVLSWVHIGDVHMRSAGQQNDLDLHAIISEISGAFADSISFVFLPGDNADHGDVHGYTAVRHALDRVRAPWCAIVGDHDVEQKSFDNFKRFMASETHYAFTVGAVRFLALNAFDIPEPPSFTILPSQLEWIEDELKRATREEQEKVILLHCYPSDLKQGGAELSRLISAHGVKLIDMGHTHYNEISHDGKTIYTATRSTGQIEEGPVGFSVTSLDHGVVSWRFLELGQLPAVIITSPADERLLADDAELDGAPSATVRVRAKVWAESEVVEVTATVGASSAQMRQIPGSHVWEAAMSCNPDGIHPIRVSVQDAQGRTASDEIRALFGSNRPARQRATRDQDNALEAWPEHGLLGTQLGPNKNGRKW